MIAFAKIAKWVLGGLFWIKITFSRSYSWVLMLRGSLQVAYELVLGE